MFIPRSWLVTARPGFDGLTVTVASAELVMGLTVTVMLVVTGVSEPEVPVTVMVADPVAEALAVNVTTSPLTDAVTPLFELDAARLTVPVNPFRSVTVVASVTLAPWSTVSALDAGVSVKLPVLPASVMVNVSVLLQPEALV
jgi:hypothetical protein